MDHPLHRKHSLVGSTSQNAVNPFHQATLSHLHRYKYSVAEMGDKEFTHNNLFENIEENKVLFLIWLTLLAFFFFLNSERFTFTPFWSKMESQLSDVTEMVLLMNR